MDWSVVSEWTMLFLLLYITYTNVRLIQRVDALGHLTVGILDSVDPNTVQTLTSEEFAEVLSANDGLAWRKWDGSEE
jgi:hypothetical protein